MIGIAAENGSVKVFSGIVAPAGNGRVRARSIIVQAAADRRTISRSPVAETTDHSRIITDNTVFIAAADKTGGSRNLIENSGRDRAVIAGVVVELSGAHQRIQPA